MLFTPISNTRVHGGFYRSAKRFGREWHDAIAFLRTIVAGIPKEVLEPGK